MKFLFTLLLIPLFSVGFFAGLMGGFVYFDRNCFRPELTEPMMHLYMSLLHLSVGCGLILNILCSLYAAAMCVVGFIIKTWLGAILTGAMAFGFFALLLYLLGVNL